MDVLLERTLHLLELARTGVAQVFVPYWTAYHILRFSVAYSFLSYLFDLYLHYRQHRIYLKHEYVPNEVVSIMDQKSFTKSRLYNIDKSIFSILTSTWGQITQQITLIFCLNAVFWNFSKTMLLKMGFDATNEYGCVCIFIFTLSLLSLVVNLPWSIYGTFVIEAKHGFNQQTPMFFAKDKAKGFILSQVLISPVVCGVQYILTNYGRMAFLYAWLLIFSFSIFIITIYPNFIAPLFDTFKPLPGGYLKDEITKMARQVGFPLTDIQVVEGSKRSSHSNAYFVGLFKNKRIVLYDTLVRSFTPTSETNRGENLEKKEDDNVDKDCLNDKRADSHKGCSDEEVLAVLCHEIGHWKFCHTYVLIFISQIHVLIGCLTFSLFRDSKPLYEAFGFYNEQPAIIGLFLVFATVYKPVDEIFNLFTMYLSRRFEFQADTFARKMHRASYLREALITLNKDNLSFPITDWLDSLVNNSHPTLLERLEALGKTD